MKIRESTARRKNTTTSVTFHFSGEEQLLQIQFSKPVLSTRFALLISKYLKKPTRSEQLHHPGNTRSG